MRIKRGLNKNKRHKKILEKTKGYRLSYSKLYKRAKEAVLHAGQYSFAQRRKRQGQFRRLWIERINAALSSHNIKYNIFINRLATKKIELNRKILADLALNNKNAFDAVVTSIK